MKLFNNLKTNDTYFDYFGDEVGKRLLGSIEIKNLSDNISAFSSYLYDLFGNTSLFSNPNEYIYSILSLPISTKFLDYDGVLKAGNASKSGVRSRWSRHRTMLFRVGYTYYVGLGINDFRSYNTYTKLKLYLPYFGLVDLNPNDVLGKYLQIFLVASSTTINATYIICVSDDPYDEIGVGNDNLFNDERVSDIDVTPLQFINFTLGVTLPIGTVDNASTQRNILMSGLQLANAINFAKSSVPLSVTTTLSSTQKNTVSSNNKQINTSQNFISKRYYDNSEFIKQQRENEIFKSSAYALNSFEQNVSTTAPASTQLMFPSSLDIHLIEYRANVREANEEYNHLFGRPVGGILSLNILRGYTEIEEVHINLEEFNEITLNELDLLENALYNGIIL